MKTLPRRSQMTRMTETTSIDRLNRVEFYPDDWEDRINFEVIWKCCQTTETIRTIKGYPRNHHYHSTWMPLKLKMIKKCSHCLWAYLKPKRKSVSSSCRQQWVLTPQNREEKQLARLKVCSPFKIHHYMYRYVWLVCKTHAKIVLSDPETLLIDDPVSLAVEAITWTITWKPPIVPVVWIMLKFF